MKLLSIKQQTNSKNPNFAKKLAAATTSQNVTRNLQQTNNINFNGNFIDSAVKFIAKHPIAVTGLATSSVVAQKIVMSGSEAVVGPAMDIGIGKAITKATNEKDGRTNQSSRVQAIRTCAQSVGGTITGVIIRTICIGLSTFALSKGGEKIGEIIAAGAKDKSNLYQTTQQLKACGKTVGGALAIGVMMFTNFLIDAPFINKINKAMAKFADKHIFKDKEVK